MSMKKIYLAGIAVMSISSSLYAQDPEFTQFYSNPLYLNPAFAGTNTCPRVCLNYRNQWPALSGTFVTESFSYDQDIKSIYGGLGIIATNDEAGEATLRTQTISVVYSYMLPVTRKFSVRFGAQAGYFQRSLDWNKLTFGDMIDPRRGFVYQTGDVPRGGSVGNVDFSAGILGYSDQFYFGFAAQHLTQPDESLIKGKSPLPTKFTGHLGAQIPMSRSKYTTNDAKISPNVLFRAQGTFTQLNIGLYISKSGLVGGVWYRNKDAFIMLIGINTAHFKLGYSYDLTMSKLGTGSGGSHELSMGLYFGCKPKRRTFRTISCPSF